MSTEKTAHNPGSSNPASTVPGSMNSFDDSAARLKENDLFRRMLRTPQPMTPDLIEAEAPVQRLPDAPKRAAFPTQDEYEEALGGWQSRVGRIKGLVKLGVKKAGI